MFEETCQEVDPTMSSENLPKRGEFSSTINHEFIKELTLI